MRGQRQAATRKRPSPARATRGATGWLGRQEWSVDSRAAPRSTPKGCKNKKTDVHAPPMDMASALSRAPAYAPGGGSIVGARLKTTHAPRVPPHEPVCVRLLFPVIASSTFFFPSSLGPRTHPCVTPSLVPIPYSTRRAAANVPSPAHAQANAVGHSRRSAYSRIFARSACVTRHIGPRPS